jgi:hypothetical protein
MPGDRGCTEARLFVLGTKEILAEVFRKLGCPVCQYRD